MMPVEVCLWTKASWPESNTLQMLCQTCTCMRTCDRIARALGMEGGSALGMEGGYRELDVHVRCFASPGRRRTPESRILAAEVCVGCPDRAPDRAQGAAEPPPYVQPDVSGHRPLCLGLPVSLAACSQALSAPLSAMRCALV